MMSARLSSNFSLISFCDAPIMALRLEVEISTAIPDFTPPNYSCLEEDSDFVNQRTAIQHDWTGLGHVSTFTQSLWWWLGGRVGMQWLAQSRSRATNLGLAGSEVGGENQPPRNHVDPLIQTGSGSRKPGNDCGGSKTYRVVITFLALVSFPSDPSWVSGWSQRSTISKRNAQS